MLKKIGLFILGLMIAVPCFAAQYCDEVTLRIDMEECRREGTYGGRMLGFELEIPAEGANGVIFNYASGQRYGFSESIWRMSYRFVIPR